MKTHELKIKPEFAVAKIVGMKSFEIRLNDRDFQFGDIVKYSCPDNSFINLAIKNRVYIITYITDYAQKDGYVVFADSELR